MQAHLRLFIVSMVKESFLLSIGLVSVRILKWFVSEYRLERDA